LVDKILILRKLAELEEYLNHLKEYSSLSLEEYQKNWKAQRIIERTLQILIEICLDIANHFISDKHLRVPESYADSFKILLEAGFIDASLFQQMEKMARFRNILVHHYDFIDAPIVIGILRKNLDDFILFRDAILKALSYQAG